MGVADTTKPVLTSLTFPSVVDVTTGGKYITFTAGATDQGLGVSSVSVSFSKSWQSVYGNTSFFSTSDSSDSFSDGVSSNQSYINDTSGAGTYDINYVYVYDKAGNYTTYDNFQLTALGIQTSFTIKSTAQLDTIRPALTSLTFPTSVDVTTGGKYITFTAGATDQGLGVSSVSVSFSKSWQGTHGNTSYFSTSDSSDSFSDGVSSNQFYIGDTSGTGVYNINYAYVYDKAGNATSYDSSQLAALGIQTSFTIKSTVQSDTTKPVLTSLTFPTSVDVTTGGKYITFTAGATDQGLGVSSVSVSFSKSWQDKYGNTSFFSTSDSSDSFSDGVSSNQYYINDTSGAGTYDVNYVYVYDKAGNFTSYDVSQLNVLGIQTSFSIIDRNVNITPTAIITAPSYAIEDNDSNISLSVTLANVSQASGTVSMSFAANQSTTINGTDVTVSNYSSTYSVTQSPAGNYTITLPSISIIKDQVDEGTETVAVTIRASGQTFDTGTDTKTVTIKLIDSGQTGTAGADTLTGTRFADDISGRDGNDVLRGGAGNDRIDGGAGTDRAIFGGAFEQSRVTIAADVVTVAGPDGTDTVTGVEQFAFIDGVFTIDARSIGAQVMRMYDTVLGRAPDAVGLDYWVDQIEDGMTLTTMASSLAASAEFQAATGGLSNIRFVDYVYTHALGRGADRDGLDYWTARLDTGLSRGEMLVQFSEAAEHQAKTALQVGRGYFQSDDTAQAIALLYDSFTGRRPDVDGLGYWTDQVKSSARTLGQVAAGFAASAEFAGATRGMSNGQLVNFMYQNTLDRGPDAGGRSYWTDQLDRGLSKGDLLLAFSQSDEHAGLMAPYIIGGIDII